jgi:WhiB family redox-sensing transcriptional regulator
MEPAAAVQLLARHDWMRDALCQEYPRVNFFPVRGEPTAAAKAVCARCLVLAECRAFIMAAPPDLAHHGVWAGTTAVERTKLRRRERPVQPEHPCAGCGKSIRAGLTCCSSTCRSRVQRRGQAA